MHKKVAAGRTRTWGGAVLFLAAAALSNGCRADDTQFMETLGPHDARFVTSLTRLTQCRIEGIHDPRQMVPL